MKLANQSTVAEFVLLGLSDHPELEKTFFVLILLMYLVILLGNGLLILVTVSDSRLHTPMYFFLGTSPSWTSATQPPPSPGPGWLPDPQENHPLLSLCHTDVPLLWHGSYRVCAPGHDGV